MVSASVAPNRLEMLSRVNRGWDMSSCLAWGAGSSSACVSITSASRSMFVQPRIHKNLCLLTLRPTMAHAAATNSSFVRTVMLAGVGNASRKAMNQSLRLLPRNRSISRKYSGGKAVHARDWSCPRSSHIHIDPRLMLRCLETLLPSTIPIDRFNLRRR